MNIALYLRHFPAAGTPIFGGSVSAIHGLASGLAENGAAVTVLCEGGQRSSVMMDAGYRVECFPRVRRVFGLHPDFTRYLHERLASRETIAVVNGIFSPGVYAVARTLAQCHVPYVAAPHESYDASMFRKNPHLKLPYWWLFERRLLRRAAAVQVLDPRHALHLGKFGIHTPAFEVSNGFGTQTVPPVSALRWRDSGPVRILFFGRINAYHKGLDILLDAFEQVSASYDVKLTIQGPDWGDRTQLEERAGNGALAGKVEFLDPDYVHSGPDVIARHDIFCMPSRREGFGLSALEAMLAARVLLVSRAAGVAPHIEASGCGVLVDADVSAVTDGFVSLLEDRAQWRERGLAGRAYALAALPWKAIAARALERYEALAA
jgi:glycosyltransferase involved in cell wall biosynthesis